MHGFLKCERGGVTVDFVALSAGVLLIGVAVAYALYNDGVAEASISATGSEALADAGARADAGDAAGKRAIK